MIEIYGKTQCPFCDKTKALCEQKGYAFTYKQLEDFLQQRNYLKCSLQELHFPKLGSMMSILRPILS